MKDSKHQDYIYTNDDYYKNPKETFTFLANIISKDYKNPSILDVGCARGEFLYYLKNNIKYDNLCGVDYSPQLIEAAQSFKGLKNVHFHVGSADDFNLNRKFDVIVMSGVLSYFDDIELTLKKLKDHLNLNGKIFILGFFNPQDVDVLIQYRNNKYFTTFESGWNYHSFATVTKVLNKLSMSVIEKYDFNLSFNLLQQEDPCRAWHIETQNGKKFINGLGLIYDIQVLEIVHNLV